MKKIAALVGELRANKATTTTDPVILSKNNLYIALGLFLLTIAFGLLTTAPGVIGSYHDDGIYVATAKALAEGNGYIQPNLPVTLPQTKYPPFLSYVFMLVWKIYPHFPGNAVYFQMICLFFSSMATSLTYLFLIRFRYSSANISLIAVTLAISSSEYLFFSTIPLFGSTVYVPGDLFILGDRGDVSQH